MSDRIDNHSPRITPEVSSRWLPGLDLLRAVWIFFVLCMHANLTQIASIHGGAGDQADLFDAVRFHLLCAAVPGFLIMSCFLQARKHLSGWSEHKNHLMDLCYLYAFWVGLWVLLTRSRPEMSPLGIVEFGMRGGGWAYYYFFVLIFVHGIAALTNKATNALVWWCLAISAGIVLIAFWMMSADAFAWTRIPTYWWPMAFLPTAFIGILLARYEPQLRASPTRTRRWAVVGLVALGLLCLLEWRWAAPLVNGELREFLPEYLRLSPTLLATLFMVGALFLGQCHTAIRYVARNSLGIFCLHVFFLGGIGKLMARFIPDPLWAGVVCVIVTTIAASILTELLRFVMKARLI